MCFKMIPWNKLVIHIHSGRRDYSTLLFLFFFLLHSVTSIVKKQNKRERSKHPTWSIFCLISLYSELKMGKFVSSVHLCECENSLLTLETVVWRKYLNSRSNNQLFWELSTASRSLLWSCHRDRHLHDNYANSICCGRPRDAFESAGKASKWTLSPDVFVKVVWSW